jgi:hypothetical protein
MVHALALTGLWGASTAMAGQTPGSYSDYQWPAGTVLNSVDFTTTVTVDPGYAANTFWSNSFDFEGGQDAYTGMQSNGGQTRTFLFSVWDATEARPGSQGSHCVDFDGEGKGKSCRLKYDWKEGHSFQFHVAQEGNHWFGVTVTDLTANVSFKIGSIRSKSAHISTDNMSSWTEYFEWGNPNSTCTNQPFSEARMAMPRGNDGHVSASIGATRKSGTCTAYSRVDIVPDGSIQTNAIGNSLRGPVIGQDGGGAACIDAQGEAASGVAAVSYDCDGKDNQDWVLGADHALQLRENLCLDIANDARAAGSPVIAYDCNKGINQRWHYEDTALKSQSTGFCLTAHGRNDQLTIEPCTGAAGQAWKIPLPPATATKSK